MIGLPTSLDFMEKRSFITTTLYHREKHENLTQDIVHHCGLSSAVILTPGRGPTVWAMHKNDVKLLVFYTNTAHLQLLQEYIVQQMCTESEKETCPYYFPRSKAIEDHGLLADELQGEEPGQEEGNGEADVEGEAGGEGDGEGEEEEHEEEEEEEEHEGDAVVEPEEPKPTLKRPAAAAQKPAKKPKAA